MMTRDSRRRRVTMLVRNAFTHDTRVEREARTLTDAGYQVTIVADARPDLPIVETRAGAMVRRVPRRGPNVPGLRFIVHVLSLGRVLEHTKPDILHAHDADALQSAGPVAARLRIPLVYDSHELWLERTARGRSPLYDLVNRLWYRWIESRYAPRASFIAVASPGLAPELERRYGVQGVRVVPNYPAEAVEVGPKDLRDLAGLDHIPDDAPIVLYLGGLMPHRGVEQLIAAIAAVPGAHLVCLGATGDILPTVKAEIEQYGIAERVHLLAPIPSEAVVPYAASATIGVSIVQPASLSYRLAVPNKLFQYMAAGLPVVASDFPDIRDIVVGSRGGVVVDPTDVDAVSAALRELLSDPIGAKAMGAAGRQAVTERFNWQISARELLEGYRSLEAA